MASETTPRDALTQLVEGNRRFLDAIAASPDPAGTTAALSIARPYAVVLACADSRVTPEIILDESLGRLFVVRVAGNTAGPAELGSIEMAVERWDCPLVMILGHTRCAAVAAALDIDEGSPGPVSGRSASMNLGGLLAAIRSNVGWSSGSARPEAWDEAVALNARRTRDSIVKWSPLIRKRVADGGIEVMAALYRVETGALELLPQ